MSKNIIFLSLLLLLLTYQLTSLLMLKKGIKNAMKLQFKKKNDNNNDDENQVEKSSTFWQGIKKFLPNISRAKIEETYTEPVPGFHNYYLYSFCCCIYYIFLIIGI